LGNVVAVTGDGTNDAPALKKADIGFAMGIMGTEVAKEASGIIILDDNFKSIITAVKWGRNIFDCVRKFLQFQLTVNVVAMFMVFLGGVVLRESPFTPIQMLWVNLIMDTFAALALATEPPGDDLLDRKPYGRTESLVTPVMWRNILGQALYQIFWLITLLFFGHKIFGIESGIQNEVWTYENGIHYTIVFNAFVFMQICNFINARKLKQTEFNVFDKFFNNEMFLGVEIITFVLQILFVELGGKAIKTSPLNFGQYLACFLIGVGGLVMGVMIKSIPSTFFDNIQLLKEEQITKEQLEYTQQGSFRRGSTLTKYRAQSSLR
jgi:Ca2+ transporting ATPase